MKQSITTAEKRVERLEYLYQSLCDRFGSAYPLARKVADQLARARVAAGIGQEGQ